MDKFHSVIYIRGILIDNIFLHLRHLITMSDSFSLLLESGALIGFLSESHTLLWHIGQLITVIIISPFVGVFVHNFANKNCKILRWEISHRICGYILNLIIRIFSYKAQLYHPYLRRSIGNIKFFGNITNNFKSLSFIGVGRDC